MNKKEIYKNEIVLSQDEAEQLLACMANQKYINSVNADSISQGKEVVDRVRSESQEVIDNMYRMLEKTIHE